MGLEDFETAGSDEAAELERWLGGRDADEDLFDFPEFELDAATRAVEALVTEPLGSTEEDEAFLAETLEGIERLVVETTADLQADESAAPRPTASAPPSVRIEPTGFDLDEDLFDFEELEGASGAAPDFVHDLESVFADDELALAHLDSQAIDDLLDELGEDHELVRPQPAPAPVLKAPVKAPAKAPASSAFHETLSPARPADAAPQAGGGKRLLETLRGRLAGLSLGWLVAALFAFNGLALVIFWSALSGMRDLVVETVHKVAAAAPPAHELQVGPPRERGPFPTPTEYVRPSAEGWDAAEVDTPAEDPKLPHERFLAAGEWSLSERAFEDARRELYGLLAQIDAVEAGARDDAEARANYLIAESYRLEAAERAPGEEP